MERLTTYKLWHQAYKGNKQQLKEIFLFVFLFLVIPSYFLYSYWSGSIITLYKSVIVGINTQSALPFEDIYSSSEGVISNVLYSAMIEFFFFIYSTSFALQLFVKGESLGFDTLIDSLRRSIGIGLVILLVLLIFIFSLLLFPPLLFLATTVLMAPILYTQNSSTGVLSSVKNALYLKYVHADKFGTFVNQVSTFCMFYILALGFNYLLEITSLPPTVIFPPKVFILGVFLFLYIAVLNELFKETQKKLKSSTNDD